MRSILYGFPLDQAAADISKPAVSPAASVVALKDFSALFTFTCEIVTDFVPVFFSAKVIVLAGSPEVPSKAWLVIVTEDDPMNPTVKAPIHAATAMLTATVTAMSMIDATTGLRAFTFFLIFLSIFIFSSIPPLGLVSMLEKVSDLNLAT